MDDVRIVQRYIVNNPAYIKNVAREDSRYINFQNTGPKGAVLHSVGTPQDSAEVFANNFSRSDAQSSVHAVIQADGLCYQLAPWNYRLWHAGGSANNTHVGVEMTEPKCIWYDANNGYKLHIDDMAKALAHVRATYRVTVELFASLCKEFGWEPLQDGVIISHAEAYKRGWGSNHGDPEHLWKATGSGYTMDTFRADVKAFMENGHRADEKPDLESQIKHLAATVGKRYHTLGDVRADADNAEYYLPTLERLIDMGHLRGKGGGGGDGLILDLSEDAVRLLVVLDRAGVL